MNWILRITVLVVSVAIVLPCIRARGGNTSLDGYTATDSQTEREWETKFRSLPSPENQKEYMRRLSARPHHVGSPYDKDNAEWILAKFKEWGLDAHIETFDVLFPTPKELKLEMVEPRKFVATLAEPPIAVDPTSSQTNEQLPAYNAYSADGEVTAPLVYVNYGMPDDYEELERYGVSVKGAIVIARYGHGWRGVKPKVAAEHGAVGCIIYSDPLDDGYTDGEVFPEWAVASACRNSARKRYGYSISRRSIDAGSSCYSERKAAELTRSHHNYQNSGAADLLCGCSAVID